MRYLSCNRRIRNKTWISYYQRTHRTRSLKNPPRTTIYLQLRNSRNRNKTQSWYDPCDRTYSRANIRRNHRRVRLGNLYSRRKHRLPVRTLRPHHRRRTRDYCVISTTYARTKISRSRTKIDN